MVREGESARPISIGVAAEVDDEIGAPIRLGQRFRTREPRPSLPCDRADESPAHHRSAAAVAARRIGEFRAHDFDSETCGGLLVDFRAVGEQPESHIGSPSRSSSTRLET